MNEYPFKLPVSGKNIVWRPLKVQESLDAAAIYRGDQNAHLLNPALYARRIIRIDGKDGTPGQSEWTAWDGFDFDAFAEEVEQKEAARRASFRKSQMGPDPMGQVKAAIEDAQLAAVNLSNKLKFLLESYEAAESKKDPLVSAQT